jgi:signal transduction histidine kinase/DNA-binding NarL/FixJ family response regulator
VEALQDEVRKKEHTRQELQEAKIDAERANRAKSDFLAHISHELRTPLNSILGFTQILKRDPFFPKSYRDSVDTIEQSGTHLLELINDLLELAKIESGKLQLNEEVFHIPTLLNGLLDLIAIPAEQKGITLEYLPFDFHKNSRVDLREAVRNGLIPDYVKADERRLKQVLLNLLSNAIKFTDKGDVILKVGNIGKDKALTFNGKNIEEALGETSEFSRIRFQIEDTGIGISPEHFTNIMEPFEQIKGQVRRHSGTGLGLAICRDLLRIMGSELKVNSVPGQGSVFWFDIELQIMKNKLQVSPSMSSKKHFDFQGKSYKVLLVDDSKPNLSVLRTHLAPLDFTIIEATNAEEGLEKAEEFKPEIAIVDLVMPGMDGFEMIRRIRGSDKIKDMVIIATSAGVFEESQARSFEAGCDSFLPKPVKADILLYQLRDHLELNLAQSSGDRLETLTRQRKIISGPNIDHMSDLIELSMVGDIEGMIFKAKEISESDPNLKVFASELIELLRSFRIGEIRDYLESFIN